jgi:hypothetical protein
MRDGSARPRAVGPAKQQPDLRAYAATGGVVSKKARCGSTISLWANEHLPQKDA